MVEVNQLLFFYSFGCRWLGLLPGLTKRRQGVFGVLLDLVLSGKNLEFRDHPAINSSDLSRTSPSSVSISENDGQKT